LWHKWPEWHLRFAALRPPGERAMASGGARTFLGDGTSLLTVAEVASAMRVSTMTVYRLIKSGELPAVRVGRSYRVRGSAVEQYLAARSVQVDGP
jgi:excisionase family DNA binding protein